MQCSAHACACMRTRGRERASQGGHGTGRLPSAADGTDARRRRTMTPTTRLALTRPPRLQRLAHRSQLHSNDKHSGDEMQQASQQQMQQARDDDDHPQQQMQMSAAAAPPAAAAAASSGTAPHAAHSSVDATAAAPVRAVPPSAVPPSAVLDMNRMVVFCADKAGMSTTDSLNSKELINKVGRRDSRSTHSALAFDSEQPCWPFLTRSPARSFGPCLQCSAVPAAAPGDLRFQRGQCAFQSRTGAQR